VPCLYPRSCRSSGNGATSRSRSLCQVSFQDCLVGGIAARSSTFAPAPPRQERRSYADPAGSCEPGDVDRGRRCGSGSVRFGSVGIGASGACRAIWTERSFCRLHQPTTTRFGRISSRTGPGSFPTPFAASRIPATRPHPVTSGHIRARPTIHCAPPGSTPVPRHRVVGCGRRHAERQRRRPRLEHPARTIHYDSNTQPEHPARTPGPNTRPETNRHDSRPQPPGPGALPNLGPTRADNPVSGGLSALTPRENPQLAGLSLAVTNPGAQTDAGRYPAPAGTAGFVPVAPALSTAPRLPGGDHTQPHSRPGWGVKPPPVLTGESPHPHQPHRPSGEA
jgi:hypothetical protein